MTPTDWAALIGAAAWLPQIFGWVSKLWTKPQVRLIASPVPEVGYNLKGPILNISGALSASRKDAVIERILATVRHEDGHTQNLEWAFASETFSQVRSATGETAEYSRSQPAVAIKVSTLALAEKLLGFQDISFQEKWAALANAFFDQAEHARRTEPDFAAAMMKSKEYRDLLEFYSRSFPWRAGSYTVDLSIFISDVKESTTQQFTFTLTKSDEDRLRRNATELARVATEVAQDVPADKRIPAYYAWTNPTLRAAKGGAPSVRSRR